MSARLTASFKLDAAAHSVVVVCQDCPWRDLAPDRRRAWGLAAAHARAAHPSQLTATLTNARQTYRNRHAPPAN